MIEPNHIESLRKLKESILPLIRKDVDKYIILYIRLLV